MSWYRTYRPAYIADLHLAQVRGQLQRLLATGQIPQVWLFAGPKGTGKTSTARIMAALVNTPANTKAIAARFSGQKTTNTPLQEPDYENELVKRIKSGQALNVQELDAASHRGIDDVRSLKERVAVPPVEGTMTVVILDEVHMLTTEAFNALLKLLEEPPKHVMFILATTELHKLPATIVSRCLVVQFTKASPTELAEAIAGIVKAEKIVADDEALSLIAEQADGSFRDGVKLAEQLVGELTELKTPAVRARLLGDLDAQLDELLTAIVAKTPEPVVKLFQTWRDNGVAASVVERTVLTKLHHYLLQTLGVDAGEAPLTQRVAHFLLSELSSVNFALLTPIPLLPLELKCLEIIFRAQDQKKGSPPTTSSSSSRPSPTTTSQVPAASSGAQAMSDVEAPAVAAAEVATEPTPPPVSDNFVALDPVESQLLLEKWQEFLAGVKQRNSSLAAILGSARPKLGDQGQAQICVFYRFHKEQLQQPKFKKMVDDSMTEVIGRLVPVEFVLEDPPLVTSDAATTASALTTLVADVLV